jgi:FkbM family methyltransferase
MSDIDDAIQIYQERGMEELVIKSLDFANWRMKDFTRYISSIFWNIKGGEQKFTINNISAVFEASGGIGKSTRWQISKEYEMIYDLIENLKNDDVFYDIGANTGLYTKFAAQVCSDIIAFEPHPPNYQYLQTHLDEDYYDNIEILQYALSDSDGEVKFGAPEDSLGHGTGSIGDGKQTVQAVKGDSIVNEKNLKHPDIVKIDVEGAEPLVIDGMKETLSNCRLVYCEIHLPDNSRNPSELYGYTPTETLLKLHNIGFEIEILNHRSGELHIVGKNTD